MLAADNAVTAHTRRTHFAAVATEPVEEVVEAGVKKGLRGWFRKILKGRTVEGATDVTRQAVVSTAILAGGVWFMTSAANLSLGWLGGTSERVNEFAEKNPVAAGGIGIGLLLGVSALGIVVLRRVTGGPSE